MNLFEKIIKYFDLKCLYFSHSCPEEGAVSQVKTRGECY